MSCINYSIAVQTLTSTDETRQISNEILSTVSSLAFGGVHSIRSQSVQGPVSYYVFLNVDYPSNYAQFVGSTFGDSSLPNPFKNSGKVITGTQRTSNLNNYVKNQSLLANIVYSIIVVAVSIIF